MTTARRWLAMAWMVVASVGIVWPAAAQDGFRFRSTTELIDVTATVTDRDGRFVRGLSRDDFEVREDGVPQRITHFSRERVPVSLGIVLDVSGSMNGEKLRAAERAIDRFLAEVLEGDDEVFLLAFSDQADVVSNWTRDRTRVLFALGRVRAQGGTALHDAVAEALPIAKSGRNRKKAVVVISDGHDTDSRTDAESLRRLIRESEVLVYAIGIDGGSSGGSRGRSAPWTGQPRTPLPFPFPTPRQWPGTPPPASGSDTDRVNAGVLRDITDDSGGFTEVVRSSADLGPATRRIAAELSQQYSLGYVPPRAPDGRWHPIDVFVQGYRVRARRGYVAQ